MVQKSNRDNNSIRSYFQLKGKNDGDLNSQAAVDWIEN